MTLRQARSVVLAAKSSSFSSLGAAKCNEDGSFSKNPIFTRLRKRGRNRPFSSRIALRGIAKAAFIRHTVRLDEQTVLHHHRD
jgi:hypothetical protein